MKMTGLWNDARFALRGLRRAPGFTLITIGTLALGIGPTAAVFGMVNQLLLRPLEGAANSGTAAYLRFGSSRSPPGLSLLDFDELRRSATLLQGVASYGLTSQNVTLDDSRPIAVMAQTIYGDFFEVLGVEPSAGRLLPASETGLDANPLVVVISESLRNRLFRPEEEVVGRTIRMNGHPVDIVGVAGGGFRGSERGMSTEAWLPHSSLVPLVDFPPESLTSRGTTMHSQVLVLPRPGVTSQAAEAQVGEILTRLAEATPGSSEYLSQLRPTMWRGLHTPPSVRDITNRTLRMMIWAVVLILTIACANVANLLLFRNLSRRGALATRRALGASTARIARQHVAESLLLGALGALAGAGIAWLIALPFKGESLTLMPGFEGFTLGSAMFVFIAATAAATVVLFGVAPAVLAGRFDLGAALRTSQARETGRVGRLRTALSAGQIAMTLALVVGGLLMVRTIANLRSVETGLEIERVVSVRVRVDSPTDLEPDELHVLHRELLAAVALLPGVERAALDVDRPHGSRSSGRIGLPGAIMGGREESRDSRPMMWQVTPGWFELFGVRPMSGRTFQDSDWRVPAADGIVLTESLARRIFGQADVAGRTVLAGSRVPVERRVVGVIGDYRTLRAPAEPTHAFFVPYGEVPETSILVLAKTRSSDSDVVAEIRRVLVSFFPDVPVPDPVLLTDSVEDIHGEQRLLSRLLGILSGFGMLMSGVGLYGVIFFVISNRKRELGIRMALGADGARIVRLVAASALTIVVRGTTLGLLAAYALSRILQSRLFGVGSLDLPSYAGAAALLALVAVLACLAPARAALRANPVATLRQE